MTSKIYRPDPAPQGLPFARKSLPALVVVFVLVSLAASPLALWGFHGGNLSIHLHALALPMAASALALVIPILVAVCGVRSIRGNPRSLLLVLPLVVLPRLAALAWAGPSYRNFHHEYGEMASDQLSRAVALQLADVANAFALSDLTVALSLFAVVVAAAFSVVAIDRARLPGGTPPLRSSAWLPATALGAVWSGLTLLAFVRSRAAATWTLPLVLTLLLVPLLACLAVAIARRSDALVGFHDQVSVRRHLAALLAAALAGVLCPWLMEGVSVARMEGESFVALCVEGVSVQERLAILSQVLQLQEHARAARWLHLVLGGATFASALLPALRRPSAQSHLPRPFLVHALALVATPALLLLALRWEASARARSLLLAADPFRAVDGVVLAEARAEGLHEGLSGDERLVVPRTGTARRWQRPMQADAPDPVEQGVRPIAMDGNLYEQSGRAVAVFADERATASVLATSLVPYRRESLQLAIRPTPIQTSLDLGQLRPLLGVQAPYFALTADPQHELTIEREKNGQLAVWYEDRPDQMARVPGANEQRETAILGWLALEAALDDRAYMQMNGMAGQTRVPLPRKAGRTALVIVDGEITVKELTEILSLAHSVYAIRHRHPPVVHVQLSTDPSLIARPRRSLVPLPSSSQAREELLKRTDPVVFSR